MYRTLIVLILLAACNRQIVNLEAEKQEILKLQAQQREHHFKKNAEGMANGSSDNFYVIDRGTVHRPKKEDQLKTFTEYFNSVEFIKWDDKKEPDIRFSKDGTVAYAAVEKLVILKTKDSNGRDIIDTTHFAWLSVYRKQNGNWILDAIASTNK